MEDCERCTLSPAIDGHWSHVSIFLLMNVNTNRTLILDMQFLFLPVEVKWKIVKDVHCPLLLMDTGLTSLSSCLQKLLQKNVHFRHAITFSISRGKIEGSERCTMSSFIEGHWSCVSIFLLTKVITKRM